MVRHIRVTSADDLDRPGGEGADAQALTRADPPLDTRASGEILHQAGASPRGRSQGYGALGATCI